MQEASENISRGNGLKLSRRGLDRLLGKISSLKGLFKHCIRFPGKWWSHHPKGHVDVALRVCFSGGLVRAGLMVGPDDLTGLFQGRFYD